jgi:hypothetical protein
MNHIKTFESFTNNLFETAPQYLTQEMKEILDLIALGGDTNTKDKDWITKFDELYGDGSLVWNLRNNEITALRKDYVSGEFSWTFRDYKGEYDHSLPEEDRVFMKDGDEKDLDKLENDGWEIYYKDLDGEPQSTWFYFLLRKPNENPFQSSIVKEYIRNYHDDLSHFSIEALSKFLSAEDARELRGLTGAKKAGLI